MKGKKFDEEDPLDTLLSMSLNEVMEMVVDAYEMFVEEEGSHPLVAKARALEEVTLWYYQDVHREHLLRRKLDEWLLDNKSGRKGD